MGSTYLYLLASVLATPMLFWWCSGLPPFTRGTVRANEAIAVFLLLMAGRWYALARLMWQMAAARALRFSSLAPWLQGGVLLGAHAVLGVLCLAAFLIWFQQLDDEHRRANAWLAAICFGLPILVTLLACWGSLPWLRARIEAHTVLLALGPPIVLLAALALVLLVRQARAR